jgi:hypothetical protein
LHRTQTVNISVVHDLGKIVKDSVQKQGMLGWQFNTIGVSDAITMGGEGLYYIAGLIPDSLLTNGRHALFTPDTGDYRRFY